MLIQEKKFTHTCDSLNLRGNTKNSSRQRVKPVRRNSPGACGRLSNDNYERINRRGRKDHKELIK